MHGGVASLVIALRRPAQRILGAARRSCALAATVGKHGQGRSLRASDRGRARRVDFAGCGVRVSFGQRAGGDGTHHASTRGDPRTRGEARSDDAMRRRQTGVTVWTSWL